MQTYKCPAIVSKDHHLTLPLPAEIPAGQVEVIVLFNAPSFSEKAERTALRLAALQRARERFGSFLSSSEEFADSKREEVSIQESRFER